MNNLILSYFIFLVAMIFVSHSVSESWDWDYEDKEKTTANEMGTSSLEDVITSKRFGRQLCGFTSKWDSRCGVGQTSTKYSLHNKISMCYSYV